MASSDDLTQEDVLQFIIEHGGKVTNHELVKNFRKFLSRPDHQAEAREKFKEIVNTVATIKQEDGVKYLVLKRKFVEDRNKDDNHKDSFGSVQETSNIERQPGNEKFRSVSVSQPPSDREHTSHLIHSHSSPSISENVAMDYNTPLHLPLQTCAASAFVPQQVSPPGPWSPDLPPGLTPQPPPRRRNSTKGKENRGAKFEESVRQLLNEEKGIQECPRKEEINEIVSPGSVKEKAQKLNRMASEIDISQKVPVTASLSARRREQRSDKADDDDACSVSTLDPRRKEWMIKAAQSNYHELLRLLREEPKLANCKDFNSYTALHWAAKHGNLDVIKLIAGTHKANTNAKTSGGYTPLHLAAMFGREEIMEVLINTYGADPNIRDYSGKRPVNYLPKDQAQRFVTLFPNMACNFSVSNKFQGVKSDKDAGFTRIGSLNSRIKKNSVITVGGRALTRMKSWGSADNIQDRARQLMPPPKTVPKKKKARKNFDHLGVPENSKGRSGDSDSDSNSGMTP